MNEEDIKKALVCCLEWHCTKCPMVGKYLCSKSLREHALDLINRQQERIEELEIITGLANNRKYYRKFVDEVFCKQKGKELSEPDFDYIYQLYFEQQAEIEQLKRNIAQCENGYSQELHLARCKLEKLKNFCTSKDAVAKELRTVNERLKAEIDDLKRDTVPKLQDSLKRANKYGIEADCENTILKAVIDDLKHEIRNLECEKGQLEGTIDFLVAEAKSEAIKDFAERLKKEVDNIWFGVNCTGETDEYKEGCLRGLVAKKNHVLYIIDNLLAEMAGEQNA